MAVTLDSVSKALDALQAAVATEGAQVTKDLNDLKVQIALGSGIKQSDVDAIVNRVTSLTSAVNAIDPEVAAQPAPTPPPAPVPAP